MEVRVSGHIVKLSEGGGTEVAMMRPIRKTTGKRGKNFDNRRKQ